MLLMEVVPALFTKLFIASGPPIMGVTPYVVPRNLAALVAADDPQGSTSRQTIYRRHQRDNHLPQVSNASHSAHGKELAMIFVFLGLRKSMALSFAIALALALALAACGREDKRLTDDKQSCHDMGHLSGSVDFNRCMEDLNNRRCATVNRKGGGGHFASIACSRL